MKKRVFVYAGVVLVLAVVGALAACKGETGPAGAPQAGTIGVQPERCGICHEGVGAGKHQAIYDKYTDKSKLELKIDKVASVKNSAGTFDSTMTFTITKDGAPYEDKDGLPGLEQKRIYAVTYDSATSQFDKMAAFGSMAATAAPGQYTAVAKGIAYAPELSKGLVYGYIADGPLDTESGGHVNMYDDVASAALAFGDVATYESVANVAGCEKCHGKPYMKHGYRDPVVAGVPDFSSCKTCHYDRRKGGHPDWQILVDNPARYAEVHAGAALTDAEKAQYAYKASVMNDVHMSHAMEFPYPQSMSNCATCHQGKLTRILTDANFKLETCKSCHPMTGPEGGTDPHRAPALKAVMPHGEQEGACNSCHTAGGIAPAFSEIHTGYNPVIYADAAGTRYSDKIAVTIDKAVFKGTDLTIDISASGTAGSLKSADIHPEVMAGLYGDDTKHFIVNGHDRYDSNNNGIISRKDGDLPKGAYEVGTEHKYFKTVSQAAGAWTVTAHLAEWADMIQDGTIRRVEIAVLPMLHNAEGEEVALNAPSRTFDLGANAFDDDFYSPIVKVADGCNKCHDALATTFHTPDRGGNIVVCRMCHVTLAGGSHLEMQSRSIDSYAHAIHSFQAFDPGDIDFADPVAAVHYDLHVEHVYPNFTIKNCKSCHNEGTFEAPGESQSLPGILSGADKVKTRERKIGAVPSYVTGPAARACGACHRAHKINEDDADGLASFNQHTKGGGYLVENGDGVLDTVIKTIMANFK